MKLLRSLFISALRSKNILSAARVPHVVQKKISHSGPPQPFDNMPFSIPNRYAATVFFSVFFGVGFWAPWAIVWYAMAKNTL